MTSVYEGDWKQRIRLRVKERGYSDLVNFSENNEAITFFELSSLLGIGIAPIQIRQLLSEDYNSNGRYEVYLRSSLVREITQAMPIGWKETTDFDFKVVSALLGWEEATAEEYDFFTKKVIRNLKSDDTIPQGWLPSGPDDPIILRLFEEAGFQEVEIKR